MSQVVVSGLNAHQAKSRLRLLALDAEVIVIKPYKLEITGDVLAIREIVRFARFMQRPA